MNNLSLKSEVLNDGTYNNYIDYRRSLYYLERDFNSGVYDLREAHEEQQSIRNKFQFDPEQFVECERIWNNNRARNRRLIEHISRWVQIGKVYFLTLTFNDSAFERSSALSRRRAVSKFLGSFDCYYVANVDFCPSSGREHYHAVLCVKDPFEGQPIKSGNKFYLNSPAFDFWGDTYGFYCLQPFSIDFTDIDIKRLAHYIGKLSNHAIKSSTGNGRLLYSKREPSWDHFKDRKNAASIILDSVPKYWKNKKLKELV